MSKVTVSVEVLRWALDRAKLKADDLQHRFPKIRQWIAGKSLPTLRQLEDFARATRTPLGFLFLEEPPEDRLPVPHFRTRAGDAMAKPSPDLLETVQTMQRRQAWMRDYLLEQGHDKFSFVHSALPTEQPQLVAQRMRHVLGFESDWAASQPTWTDALRTLREAIEDVGILVVTNGIVGSNTHRKLDPTEFRGFVLVDDYAPLLFVNGADGKAAQMFTVAHELAHVFFGSSAAFDLREMQAANDPTEQLCNRVAAEFLVPEQALRQEWPSVKGEPEPFQKCARRFKVSALVAARRALELGLVSKGAFLDFYYAYERDERRTLARHAGGGDFYANQNLRVGRRFASAVVRATHEGKLLYAEAFRLTGMYGKTFDRYARSLGILGA